MISKKNFAKVSATLGAVALGVSATATAANADTIYTVQSGDTLSGISYKFAKNNSMINDLAKKNNIQDINKIFVGQKLIIKSDGEIQEYNAQNAANANVNTQQAAQQNTQTTQAQQTQNQATKAILQMLLVQKLLLRLGLLVVNLVVTTVLQMVNTLVSTNYQHHTLMVITLQQTKNG